MKIINFLLLLLTSCSTQQSKPQPPSARVEVDKAHIEDIPIYIEAIGNIHESAIVQIRPQVQGIILNSYVVQEGFVQAGDLLYEIDPRPYQAVLDQAKATLLKDEAAVELAKSTLKRYQDLVNKDFISKLTYEQYKTNVDSAEAQVQIDKAAIDSAQINLGYCRIISPINGKLSISNIDPGNLVLVNDVNALIEIRQITPIQVRFSIPQRDFQEIQRYQEIENLKLRITLPFDNNREFIGILSAIDNHIDLKTGTILLKGIISNEERVLWPGEFVKVRMILKTRPNTVVIPFAALQVGQNGKYVYKWESDETVRAVTVETGEKVGESVVIYSGLNEGDVVVTNGQLNLANGSKVQIVTKTSENQEME